MLDTAVLGGSRGAWGGDKRRRIATALVLPSIFVFLAFAVQSAASDSPDPEICTVASECQHGRIGELGGEFNFPYDIATDGAGDVYVEDTANNRIQKFDSSGNFVSAWGQDVVDGGGTGFEICTVATACQAGNGGEFGGRIATDSAGNVYIGGFGRIQKFDSSGNFLRAWGKDVVAGGGTGAEICTVAADCQPGSSGELGGEFDGNFDVATDPSGNVYVSEVDIGNNRIQKFDSSGNFLRAWGKDVVSGGGTGFEICTVASECQRGSKGELGGEFFTPIELATDSSGNVYIVDLNNARIQKFDPAGNFLRAWGKDVLAGGGTGSEICTVAADCRGGTTGLLGGEFDNVEGVATDAAGNVYASEISTAFSIENNRIQKFDSSGNFLAAWGKDVVAGGGTGSEICTVAADCKRGAVGALGGELEVPAGLATDTAGNVYVADSYNHRIQKFDSSGSFLRTWGGDVVDTVPPDTAIDLGPADPTHDSTPSLRFHSTEPGSSFECSVDGAAFVSCSSPFISGQLADGPHGFEVRATDIAANTDPTPASRGFTVDTSAPETLITKGPLGRTHDRTPTFRFRSTEQGSRFRCMVDRRHERCSSPDNLKRLPYGKHRFAVKAVDPAGNVDLTSVVRRFKIVRST